MSDIKINELKNIIAQKVNKGFVIQWPFIQDYILENELEKHFCEQLRRWYELIFEQAYLNELPVDAEELFFHNNQESEIKVKDLKEPFYHDIHEDDFELAFKVLSIQNQATWNYSNPFCSFYLKKDHLSFRVSLAHKSLNPDLFSKVFFRILNKNHISLSYYSHSDVLIEFIKEKKNIIIAGSTGSGKTTLINSLLEKTEKNEHVIILEDTYELISPSSKATRLISGEEENSNLDSLLTYSLRMSPDRIIIGELRSKEVTTFIQAMNTGHKGIMTTVHANSASDALSRIALLFVMYSGTTVSYELALKLVCQNIDQVVFIENKKINQIIDVFGAEGSDIYFDRKFDIKQDSLMRQTL